MLNGEAPPCQRSTIEYKIKLHCGDLNKLSQEYRQNFQENTGVYLT